MDLDQLHNILPCVSCQVITKRMRRLKDGRIIVKILCEIFQLPFFSSSLLHMQLCCSDFYPGIFIGTNLRKNSCQGGRLYGFADIV